MGELPLAGLRWLAAAHFPVVGGFATRQRHGHSVFHKLAHSPSAPSSPDHLLPALQCVLDVFLSSGDDGQKALAEALEPDASGRRASDIARCLGLAHLAAALHDIEASHGRGVEREKGKL
mmetsp:Transcript_7281/g.22422  ORF Transcript_7281/g.22422 Transcript_7281/m.22422 type:complete len:120 (-) Transcript_7281:29-388(-)